jgi:hypothetical protein
MKCALILFAMFESGTPVYINTCQVAAIEQGKCTAVSGDRRPCTKVFFPGSNVPYELAETRPEAVQKKMGF